MPLSFADFTERALAEFPQLTDEIEDNDGFPCMQVEALARLMQRAKGSGDWDAYARAARLADELWGRADDSLTNALNVSLWEHLDFAGPRGPRAWELLSPRAQRAWTGMAAYNNWIRGGMKGPCPAAAPRR
jgi:hypothetical protein